MESNLDDASAAGDGYPDDDALSEQLSEQSPAIESRFDVAGRGD
jgi:hypothetical protein